MEERDEVAGERKKVLQDYAVGDDPGPSEGSVGKDEDRDLNENAAEDTGGEDE